MAERPSDAELLAGLRGVGTLYTATRLDPHPFDQRGRPSFGDARWRIEGLGWIVTVHFRRHHWYYLDTIEGAGWSAESFADDGFGDEVAYWRPEPSAAAAWGVPMRCYHTRPWRVAIERRLIEAGLLSVVSPRGNAALAGFALMEAVEHLAHGRRLDAEDAVDEVRGHLRAARVLAAMGVGRG